MRRVYLAGPDVFLPRPWERGEVLRAICAQYGLEGVFPLDGSEPGDAIPPAAVIAAANEAHIRNCDAVLANLTPFRGASADAGTVYEVGFARGLGRPVVGYSNDARTYEQRCAQGPADGLAVEAFGLAENLMIACGVDALYACTVAEGALWTDLAGVHLAARRIAGLLSGTSAGATG
ncbi:nucleoside 2-deoxyribosyltransferase [Endobacter medicaginis]|uniref:Nucleoside 2-deoxyribosyltransferase n=1 Tax=Endobacter medicaginis TaxID=1181271 RepID=A0A839V3F8_9PROT|nr:nucleoside 2-deoxyribosyltransferase [Endobacter medicaginis]MBB3175313.1 nucleoside 2-deoxyribosyltransferase [Endobacter medicaginis]MCX5476913.1 nucleoside 2-deoxyribosyltransferase [Endobacter medicaginis]NVN30795.1 nucleoside 2-deoxyribosyltransferase [Endobacter medicaginis]